MATFVDTNVFIRALVDSSSDEYREMAEQARRLFRRGASGEETLVTSEAHIAEVLCVLCSPRRWHLPREQAASIVSTLLREAKIHVAHADVVFSALELVVQRPALGFADALAYAYADHNQLSLATFDRVLRELPGVRAWDPVK